MTITNNLDRYSNDFHGMVSIFSLNIFEICISILILSVFIVIQSTNDSLSNFEHSLITPGIDNTIKEINYMLSSNLINIEDVIKPIDEYGVKQYNNDSMRPNNVKLIDMLLVLDPKGNIIYANQDTLKELDISYVETIGESIFDIYEKFNYFDKSWYEKLRFGKKSKIIIKIHEQKEKWYVLTHSVSLDSKGNVESILVSGNDVTFLIDSNDVKNIYAEKDSLTGLTNQYGVHEKIKHLRNVKSAAAFFIQVLHFTEISNYYGHEICDKLLNKVVAELKNIVSEDCIIARYTDSKFLILCTDESLKCTILGKFKEFINSSYIIDNLNLQVDKRMGYAYYPDDTNNLEELLTLSSIALKETILSNSYSMVRFESRMQDQLKYNIEIANKLKVALDNGTIEVYFQKIIDCNTKKVCILEELSRWNDNELGFIPPIDFFRIAKHTNQLNRLDRYMVEKSILAFKELKLDKQYENVKLTINISPESLLDLNFKDFVNKIIIREKINTEDIYIEISESTFINNLELCIDRINDYKVNGFKIALDDFGTEYSSLSVLESVDFDIIKMDQHFIKNIEKAENVEIIKMIRKVVDISNKEMVAEGVETKEQSDLLRVLGCSIQQGYYLHRPEKLN
ncbi:sensor domain-containing phosphodiesterase [Mycoplasmatota bacterium WC30]